MEKFKTSRIFVATPFFLVGAGFLCGAAWLGIDRLFGGFEWKENDSFIIGWLIALVIFGGAMLQFGKDALYKGHSKDFKPLVGPIIYYIIGVLFIVLGIWSFLAGSQQALMVAAVGIASVIFGVKLSIRAKKSALTRPST